MCHTHIIKFIIFCKKFNFILQSEKDLILTEMLILIEQICNLLLNIAITKVILRSKLLDYLND